MALIINVRAGEGGADSKLLVQDMVGIYKKWIVANKINILSEG